MLITLARKPLNGSVSVADKTERGFADTGGASRYFKQIG